MLCRLETDEANFEEAREATQGFAGLDSKVICVCVCVYIFLYIYIYIYIYVYVYVYMHTYVTCMCVFKRQVR
jgi:hypothetical protein